MQVEKINSGHSLVNAAFDLGYLLESQRDGGMEDKRNGWSNRISSLKRVKSCTIFPNKCGKELKIAMVKEN